VISIRGCHHNQVLIFSRKWQEFEARDKPQELATGPGPISVPKYRKSELYWMQTDHIEIEREVYKRQTMINDRCVVSSSID
jgi:hypothetical protein